MKLLDYIRGARKGKEAHRIEYDAMSDPFLADALDGFDSVEGNHADRIAQMQARVTARATKHKKRSGAWRIAVATIAFIAVISGYFTLMNHESSMVVAGCDNCFIDIYAPEDYIERKRLELTLEQEQNPNKDVIATAIVNIENLDEVIKPIERIVVYLPGNYAQMKRGETEELRIMESRHRQEQERIQSRDYLEEVQEKTVSSLPVPAAIVLAEESINKPSIDQSLQGKVAGLSVSEGKQGSSAVLAQRRVSGQIVDDETGEPIVGAVVTVKGSKKGTVTNLDGYFTLETDSETAKLIASYIGYDSVEIPDPSQAKIVAMKPSNATLDEIVVVGYGRASKKSMVSSSSIVMAEKVQKIKSKPVIGENAYNNYLKENTIRPSSGECVDRKGKVVLEFTIDSSGRPQNIEIVKSLCSDLDNEAIRLVQLGSDWTQGTEKVKLDVHFK